jgi:hypothetical protein
VKADPGLQAVVAHVATALEQVGLAYAVVGSLAASIHGEPRSTRDVDVAVRLSQPDIDRLAPLFPDADFYFDIDMARDAVARQSQFNVIDLRSMWKVDFIVARDAFTHEELARRERVSIGGTGVYVASAEDTVVAKLKWSREAGSHRQLEDAAGILRVCGGRLDRRHIAAWVERFGLATEWAEVEALASG